MKSFPERNVRIALRQVIRLNWILKLLGMTKTSRLPIYQRCDVIGLTKNLFRNGSVEFDAVATHETSIDRFALGDTLASRVYTRSVCSIAHLSVATSCARCSTPRWVASAGASAAQLLSAVGDGRPADAALDSGRLYRAALRRRPLSQQTGSSPRWPRNLQAGSLAIDGGPGGRCRSLGCYPLPSVPLISARY